MTEDRDGLDQTGLHGFGEGPRSDPVHVVRANALQNGRTSAFELVRLGADLATAQQRYSDALVRTARALAALRQLTGGAYPSTPGTTSEGNEP